MKTQSKLGHPAPSVKSRLLKNTKSSEIDQRTEKMLSERLCSRLGTKRRGEVAEAAFLHKATTLGFSVAKPWGESDRYDFFLDNGARSWRIQVKSAFSQAEDGYTFRAAGSVPTKTYTARDIDFIVAYVAPEDIWYVIPVAVFGNIQTAKLRPQPKRRPSRFEKYREAWCLLACPKDGQCRSQVDVVRPCQRSVEGGNRRCPKDE